MRNFFVTGFKKLSFCEVLEPRKSTLTEKPIYRDELDKRVSKKKVEKKSDRFAYSKPLLPREDGKVFVKKSYGGVPKKEVITIKVKMTKQEAARMFSKCKDGGLLDFKDVALELVHIPPSHVQVVSSDARIPLVLESIPEEL